MKSRMSKREGASHVTRGSVLDDLGFTAAEALEIKVKGEVYRELLAYIKELGFDQQRLAAALGVHQPEVSHLLNGKISKFSVGKLIKFAGKLNLAARVRITNPGSGKAASVTAAARCAETMQKHLA